MKKTMRLEVVSHYSRTRTILRARMSADGTRAEISAGQLRAAALRCYAGTDYLDLPAGGWEPRQDGSAICYL